MAHDKVQGKKLWQSQKYLLHGQFWDGFRGSAKWTAPLYCLFFIVAMIGSKTIWNALWCLLMVVVSTIVIYLAWKQTE